MQQYPRLVFLRYLMLPLVMLLLVGFSAWGQSRIPTGTDTYLQVVSELDDGSLDRVNVVFFAVPDTVTSTLYFAIRDPEGEDLGPNLYAEDLQGGDGTGTPFVQTTYSLVGGAGTISEAVSRKDVYDQTSEVDPGLHKTGTILEEYVYDVDGLSGAPTVEDDDEWVYFPGVSPAQGEKIGNTYYFKVVTTAQDTSTATGDGSQTRLKNAYQLDISLTNSGTPTGVGGVRAFAYGWTIALLGELSGQTYNMYPFVPDRATGDIEYWNYDMDDEGDTTSAEKIDGSVPTEGASVEVSGNGTSASTSFVLSGGVSGVDVNGTWRETIVESGAGLAQNTADFWYINDADGDEGVSTADDRQVLRAYADYYLPTQPHHVAVSVQDGIATADGADEEQITFQIVDDEGNPVPYERDLYVTLTEENGDASSDIVETSSDGTGSFGQAQLVTTNGDGIGFIRITNSEAEDVEIAVEADGAGAGDSTNDDRLPATGTLGTNGSATVVFQTGIATPSLSTGADTTVAEGSTVQIGGGSALTVTEATTPRITAANDIYIRIPPTIGAEFDTTVTTVGFTGDTGNIDTSGVTYPDNRTLRIDVTTDFAAGASIDIGTTNPLEVTGVSSSPAESLELSYSGPDGPYNVVDANTITVNGYTTYVWQGDDGTTPTDWGTPANWDQGMVPDGGTANVLIPSSGVPDFPVLGQAPSVYNISISSGASLDFNGQTLTVGGSLSNDGTIILDGAAAEDDGISAFDVDSGTIRYDSDGSTLVAGTTYNNLEFTDPNTTANSYTFPSDIDVNGSFTIGAGATVQDGGNTAFVAGDWTLDPAGTFTSNSDAGGTGTVEFDGSDTSVITEDTTFYNLTIDSPGKVIEFTDGSTQTVNGTFRAVGASGNLVRLRSTTDGAQWNLDNVGDAENVQFVAVQDSDLLGTGSVTAFSSVNNGNNDQETTNDTAQWIFDGTTYEWNGSGTDWDGTTGANWTPNGNPGPNDTVIIPNTGTDPVLTAAADVKALEVRSGATLDLNGQNLSVADQITNVGRIRSQGSETVTINGNTGTAIADLNADSGTVEYYQGSSLVLGQSYFDLEITGGGPWNVTDPTTVNGELLVNSGGNATFSDAANSIPRLTAPTVVNLTVATATDLDFGGGAIDGDLILQAGGALAFGPFSLPGSVDLSGNTTLLSDETGAVAGIDITGTVTIAGGGSLRMGPLSAGNALRVGGTVGTGAVDIPVASLDNLPEGFSEIQLGGASQSGTVTLAGGPTGNWLDSVSVQAPNGDIVVSAAVDTSASSDLASVTLNGDGTTTTLSGNIRTDGGNVTINDTVLLDGTPLIDTEQGNNSAAGNVTITGAIDALNGNGDTLTVNTVSTGGADGFVELQGAYGTNTVTGSAGLTGPLDIDAGQIDVDAVHVDGGTISLTGSNIDLNGTTYQTTGSGAIGFTGPVDLGLDTGGTILVQTPGGVDADDITFTSTVQDPSAGTADQLELNTNNGGGAGGAGDVIVSGAVGNGTDDPGGFTVSGGQQVDLNAVTVVGGPIDVTASNIDLNATSYQARTSGEISFAGPVTLAVAGGTVQLQTSGAAATDSISMTSTVDDNAGGDSALTLNADVGGSGNGAVSVTGAIGGNTPIGALTVSGTPAQARLANVTVASADVSVTASDIVLTGTTYETTTSGAISFTGPVTLNASPTVSSAGTSAVQFGGTVDADGVGNDRYLVVNAGGGASFGGAIGGSVALDAVDVDGASVAVGSIATEDGSALTTDRGTAQAAVDVNATGGTLTFELAGAAGAAINTTGETDGGAVNLTASGGIELDDVEAAGDGGRELSIVSDTGGTDGSVTVNSAVDDAGNDTSANTVLVQAGGGTVTFDAAVGGSTPLGGFDVDSAGTASLQAVTTDAGDIVVGNGTADRPGTVTLNGDLTSHNGTDGAGAITIHGDSVELTANGGTDGTITLDTDGSSDGNVTLTSDVTSGVNSSVAWADGLTVRAGTGGFTIANATLLDLDHLDVIADAVSLGDLSLGDGAGNTNIADTALFVQTTGGGNLTLNGDIDTTGDTGTNNAGEIDLSNVSGVIELAAGGTNAANTVTITTNAAGTDRPISLGAVEDTSGTPLALELDAGGSDVALDGEIGGTNRIGELLITEAGTPGNPGANDVGINANVSSGAITIRTQDGPGPDVDSIAIGAVTVDSNGGDVVLRSDDIGVDGAATLQSTGGATQIAFGAEAVGSAIDVGDGATTGVLDLSEAELQRVGATFAELIVGASGQTGLITVNDTGGLTGLNTALRLRGPVSVASDIVQTTEAITIGGTLLVDGVVSLDTTGGDTVDAAAITFTGAIDGANVDGDDELTVAAAYSSGAAAAVEFQADVEGGTGTASVSNGEDLELLDVSGSTVDLANVTIDGANAGDEIRVSGTAINLNGTTYETTTSGAISFTGPVNLNLDTGGTILVQSAGSSDADDISFSSSIQDPAGGTADQLELNSNGGGAAGGTGDVTVSGAVGNGTDDPAGFTISGGDQVDLSDVRVSAGSVDVSGGNIDLNSTSYQTTTDGSIRFNGPVDLDAGGAVLVQTPGTATGPDTITFEGTIQDADNGDTLELNANGGTSGAGGQAVAVVGDIGDGAGNDPAGFTVSGAAQVGLASVYVGDGALLVRGSNIDLNGAEYQIVGGAGGNDPMSFEGAVDLHASVTVTGAGNDGLGDEVSFSSTIDADLAANLRSLDVNAGAGNVSVGAAIGSAEELTGGVTLNGGQIDTLDITSSAASNEDPGGAVSITGGGAVTIDGAITTRGGPDGGSDGGHAGGTVTLTGATVAVGAVDTLGSDAAGGDGGPGGDVTMTASGGTPQITLNGNISTSGGAHAGGTAGTSGVITLNDPVILGTTGGDIAIDTTNGGLGNPAGANVTFNAGVDASTSGAETLSVDGGSGGNVNVVGDVGAGPEPGAFTVSQAAQVDLNSVSVNGGPIDVTGSAIDLNGSSYTATGAGGQADVLRFDGPVTLNAPAGTITVQARGGEEADDILFTSTVNDTGSDNTLALGASNAGGAGSGDLAISGIVGGVAALGGFTVDPSTEDVTLQAVTTDAGPIRIGTGAAAANRVGGLVTLNGNLTSHAGGTGDAGDIGVYGEGITLGAAATQLNSNAPSGTDGDIRIADGGGTTSPTTAWVEGLSLLADTGIVDYSAADLTDLDHLVITGASASLGDTLLGDGASNAASPNVALRVDTTGNLTLNGDIDTTGDTGTNNAGEIDLSNVSGVIELAAGGTNGANIVTITTNAAGTDRPISLGAVGDTSGTPLALELDAGSSTVSTAAVGTSTTRIGQLSATGATVNLDGNTYATGIDVVATTLVDVDSPGAGVTVNTATGNIDLAGADIAIDPGVTISGTGGEAVILRGNTAGTTIGLGNPGAGSVNLSEGELATVDGTNIAQVQIGDPAGQDALVTIDDSNDTATANVFGFNRTDLVINVAGATGGALSQATGGALDLTGNGGGHNLQVDGGGAGGTTLRTDISTQGGTVTIDDAVTLGADVVIDSAVSAAPGAAVEIDNTTGAGTVDGGQRLTVDAGTGGDVTFDSAVGGGTPLDALVIERGGTVTLQAVSATAGTGGVDVGSVAAVGGIAANGNISSNGGTDADIRLDGPLTLGASVTLDTDLTGEGTNTAGGDVILTANATVDGSDTHSLTLDATADALSAGTVSLGAAAGTGTGSELTAFTVIGAAQVDLADVLVNAGSIDVTGGNIDLNSTSYQTTTDGSIRFNGPVDLDAGGAVVVQTPGTGTGPDTITFESTIQDADNGDTLELNANGGTSGAGGQAVTVLGDIGDGAGNDPAGFTVSGAAQVDLASVYVSGGSIAVTGSGIDLNAGFYQTSGNGSVTLDGPVILAQGGGTTRIITPGGAGDDVVFTDLVDDNAAGDTALVINADSGGGGNGTVDLQGDLGASSAVAAFTVSGTPAQVDLENVYAEGGNVSVTAANIDLNAGTYQTTTSGEISFSGPVDLDLAGGTVAVLTAGAVGDGITFGDTVDDDAADDGTQDTVLDIDAGDGTLRFDGAVGAGNALRYLRLLGAGPVEGATPIDLSSQDVYVDAPTRTLELRQDVTVGRLVFYRGTIDLSTGGPVTLETVGDFVVFGPEYVGEDVDRGTSSPDNAFFRYPEGVAFGTPSEFVSEPLLYVSPAFTTMTDGDSSNDPATPVADASSFAPLDGATIRVGGDFYVNGADMTGTAPWTLDITQDNSAPDLAAGLPQWSFGADYAVAFNMEVENSDASSGSPVAAAVGSGGETNNNVTDAAPGGTNTNWDFARPEFVSSPTANFTRTVFDNVIRITFDEPIENSSNEISRLIGSGAFQINGDTVQITHTWIDNDGDNAPPHSFESTDGRGDLDTFFVRVPVADSWNTDATGSNPGDTDGLQADSTDRNGVQRSAVPDIAILKGVLADANGHNLIGNFGRNGRLRYAGAADGARPVLVEVLTGRAVPSNTTYPEASGHNLFRLRYSEPVDIGGLTTDETDTTASNVRSETTFNNDAEHGGHFQESVASSVGSPGVVDVVGYFQYAGSMITGTRNSAEPSNNALYRAAPANPHGGHGLTIFAVGYSFDPGTGRIWPGYMFGNSRAGGSATEVLGTPGNYPFNISDPAGELAQATENPHITDAAGNVIEPDVVQYDNDFDAKAAVTITDELSPQPEELSGWDHEAPGVSTFSAGVSSEIITRIDPVTNKVTHLDFFFQDNFVSEDVPWTPETDHVDARTPLRGIRDTTFSYPDANESPTLDELQAFRVQENGFAPESTFNVTLGTETFNFLFSDTDTPQLVNTPNDGYLGLRVDDAAHDWTNLTDLWFRYDAPDARVTDLAGNMLPSTPAGEDFNLSVIERIPPRIELSLIRVGDNRVFVRFSEPVYGDFGGSTEIDPGMFVLEENGAPAGISVTDIEPVLYDEDGIGILEAYFTLSEDIDADFAVDGRMLVAGADTVYDELQNAMIPNVRYRISDIGIGVVEPVLATDSLREYEGFGEDFTSIRDFTGATAGLVPGELRLQARIRAANHTDDLLRLFYDVEPAEDSLVEDPGAVDFWLPSQVQGYNLITNPEARAILPYQYNSSGELRTFRIPEEEEITEGTEVEFVFRLGDLFTARSADPDDPRALAPYLIPLRGIIDQRSNVTILNNVINPLSGDKAYLTYDLPNSGVVRVVIFTVNGDVVRVFHSGRQGAGSYTYAWDGTNERGHPVARGVYFIRVVGPDFDEYRKVMVVK